MFIRIALFISILFIGIEYSLALSCVGTFRENELQWKAFNRPFFYKNEIRDIVTYAKSAPPLMPTESGIIWENPLKALGYIALKNGEFEFTWDFYRVSEPRYSHPKKVIFSHLEKAILGAAKSLVESFPEAKEFFDKDVVVGRATLIRYVMEKGRLTSGVDLHRDGENYHGTILLEIPKRGSGSDLVIESLENERTQMQVSYAKNQLNIFEGVNQYHGVTAYNLENSLGNRTKTVERVLLAVFFRNKSQLDNSTQGYKQAEPF